MKIFILLLLVVLLVEGKGGGGRGGSGGRGRGGSIFGGGSRRTNFIWISRISGGIIFVNNCAFTIMKHKLFTFDYNKAINNCLFWSKRLER